MKPPSINRIFSLLFYIYLLILLVAYMGKLNTQSVKQQRELYSFRPEILVSDTPQENEEGTSKERPADGEAIAYRFSNPKLAYKILMQLNVLDKSNPYSGYTPITPQKMPYVHLKVDDEYCNKHTKYITEHPETIFEPPHFISDVPPDVIMRREVIPAMGNDIQPHIGHHMPRNVTKLFDIRPEVSIFLTRNELYREKRIGQHFSCLTQASSHFPSNQVFDRRNRLVEAINKYSKRYAGRPQCFDSAKFFPKSYLLYDKQECMEFFKIFNSPEYQILKKERKIVYIRKLGANVHMGEGVDPIHDKQEQELREMYDNGAKCGQITTRYFIQDFIHNPLLINGRKFDFRIYVLFASLNPMIVYYHDGFLRVTLDQYDVNSDDKKVLLTNLALNKEVYSSARNGILYQGMDEMELKHAQQWSYARLLAYLMEQGIVTDPNWLDNYLKPQFKKALAHLTRFTIIDAYQHSSVFQIYGVDFMLDEDLNLWFIEANSKAGQNGYSREIDKAMIKMFQDHVEIALLLLRSRTKRIINYVNALIEEGVAKENERGDVTIQDLNNKRMEFKNLTKNWFEEEFEPGPSNGFQKIVDENYIGAERYQGLIAEECL